MRRVMSDIRAFHERFGLEYDGEPRELPKDLRDFRYRFLEEELEEYEAAAEEGDLPGMFDALIDLIYVAAGTLYLHGFPAELGWERVHGANMKKVRAGDAGESKRLSTHDVVKPHGWEEPDLGELLDAPFRPRDGSLVLPVDNGEESDEDASC